MSLVDKQPPPKENKQNQSVIDENCDEGVFFEAVCKSISYGTNEDELLDFIEQNIFSSIRECVAKDDIMMLPGKSIAIFELFDKKQIKELNNIIQSKMNELTFNGNIFSLKQLKTINIVNDKNVVDYLMGFGFEHGIKIKDNKTDEKHDKNGEKKNFYFKLPAEAKQYVTKQAESLEIPKTALVLMLGVLTTNGPIPIAHYRGWKTNNPNIVGILGTENISPNKNKSANNKVDIVPNSTDKNSHTLSFNKSLLHVGEISLTNNKSFNSQCSPANDSKRPLNQDVNKKQARKMAISNSNNTSSLIKALINKGSLNQNKNNNRNNTTQSATISTKTLYKTLGSSQLFQNNAARNLLTNNKLNTINSLTLLSPNASALFSPRHTGVNNNSIIGRNDTANANVGNGFRMTAPTANIAPVHVPYLGQNNNDISPINYNITPPAIITPLAITPTTKLPFYWSNIHFGVSFKCNNINNNNMNSQAPPYVQKQLQNSVNNHATSTVFKYPIRNDNIMNDSSRNLLLNSLNSLNTLIQQQSITSYGTNDNNINNNNNNNNDRMEEGHNIKSIPPVVMISNLNKDEINCDKIFTLCGVFGNVQRVKISYHKRDTAFVQLSNHRQAKHVITKLNRIQLYGKIIHVKLSHMTRVKLPNNALMFPDAKLLTKDYTNSKKHRYSKKGAGGQPSHILHIVNLPIQTETKQLQEFLCHNNSNKIQNIELINVNNKLESCEAFVKCHSVDIACQILIDFHGRQFLGREINISFATYPHMPSDINQYNNNDNINVETQKIISNNVGKTISVDYKKLILIPTKTIEAFKTKIAQTFENTKILAYYLKYTMYMQINDQFAKIYDDEIILFNPDLDHSVSHNRMCCIIHSIKNKWTLQDIVPFSTICAIYKISINDLPLSSRIKHSFASQLHKNIILTHSVINKLSLKHISFVKGKSNKTIPNKDIIMNQLNQFIGNKEHLTPIVRFNLKRNQHWIEYVLMCQQENTRFGVSFKCNYNNENWTITSVFLNQMDIKRQYVLTGIPQQLNNI